MPDWEQCAGNDEALPVTQHNEYVPQRNQRRRSLSLSGPHGSVYPAIDPQPLYDSQAYSGKVVLVTGASRGIGQEIALQYARAGAALAIVARSEEALGEAKCAILEAVPSAEVLVIVADVRDTQSAERAVQALLARFGSLDILVANAGVISPIHQSPCCTLPLLFWKVTYFSFCTYQSYTRRTRMRGGIRLRLMSAGCSISSGAPRVSLITEISFAAEVVPSFSAAVLALEQSHGYFVAISSVGAQVRNPGTSDASMSKHVVNRLIEFIALGSSYPFCVGNHSLIPCAAQNTPACVRLCSRLASSARDCSLRLELESPLIQSRFPRQRHSISHLGARTGFPEGS